MKKLIVLGLSFIFFALAAGDSRAQIATSASSAKLKSHVHEEEVDHRARILQEYLTQHDSPLAKHADTFINTADKYDLDWRLVASIAGLESSYGKHQPEGSHNGWGWGYNNGRVKHFTSWDEAIEEISYGLRNNYLYEVEGSDPYIIGPKYAASPTWASRVIYFMDRIENYKINNSVSTLTLDI